MRVRTQNFIIPLVVYPFDVMVSVEQTDDELKKELQKYTNSNIDVLMNLPPTTLGRCAMLECNQTVIRLKRQLFKHEYNATVAHEIFHAVGFIMNRVGMKLELGVSDEAYAYLIGYLTKEIYKRI